MVAVHADEPTPLRPWLVDGPTALVRQCVKDRAGDTHLDGWGITWYADDPLASARPQVLRSVLAAPSDPRFAATAEAAVARIALAHARDGSVGSIREENCHPFVFGRWSFCHNGTIEDFEKLKPAFDRETLPELRGTRRGDTDSEHLFLWLLSNARREGYALTSDVPKPESTLIDVDGAYEIVRESLRRLLGWCEAVDAKPPTGLNLLLTDGRILVAARYGRTLWMRREGAATSARPIIIVASEPTDDADDWREVSDRGILTIDAAGTLVARPLSAL
jgi:glutamine amidotransferase